MREGISLSLLFLLLFHHTESAFLEARLRTRKKNKQLPLDFSEQIPKGPKLERREHQTPALQSQQLAERFEYLKRVQPLSWLRTKVQLWKTTFKKNITIKFPDTHYFGFNAYFQIWVLILENREQAALRTELRVRYDGKLGRSRSRCNAHIYQTADFSTKFFLSKSTKTLRAAQNQQANKEFQASINASLGEQLTTLRDPQPPCQRASISQITVLGLNLFCLNSKDISSPGSQRHPLLL